MSQRRAEAEADETSERSRREPDRPKPSKRGRSGVHSLQRAAGNQALQAIYEGGAIPRGPTVSQPDDSAEREAERVSDEVLSMPAPETAASDGTETTTDQNRRSAHAGAEGPAVTSLRGTGRPLPSSVRSFFEPRFGLPLGDVRVHTGD